MEKNNEYYLMKTLDEINTIMEYSKAKGRIIRNNFKKIIY